MGSLWSGKLILTSTGGFATDSFWSGKLALTSTWRICYAFILIRSSVDLPLEHTFTWTNACNHNDPVFGQKGLSKQSVLFLVMQHVVQMGL